MRRQFVFWGRVMYIYRMHEKTRKPEPLVNAFRNPPDKVAIDIADSFGNAVICREWLSRVFEVLKGMKHKVRDLRVYQLLTGMQPPAPR